MHLDKKEEYLFAYSKIYSENKRKIEKNKVIERKFLNLKQIFMFRT